MVIPHARGRSGLNADPRSCSCSINRWLPRHRAPHRFCESAGQLEDALGSGRLARLHVRKDADVSIPRENRLSGSRLRKILALTRWIEPLTNPSGQKEIWLCRRQLVSVPSGRTLDLRRNAVRCVQAQRHSRSNRLVDIPFDVLTGFCFKFR